MECMAMDTRRLESTAHGYSIVTDTPRVGGLSFERFYSVEFPRMVEIAHVRSGSRMAAEDLAQDAMIAAYRQWADVGSLDRPGAWVRRVVLNRAASAYHRKKAEARALLRLAPLRGEPPESLSTETEAFWSEVRSLPTRQGDALILHYLGELSITEIAEVLDCAEGTVKVHLHRGRSALAQRLTREENGT